GREAMAADLGGVVDDDIEDGVSSTALACLLHHRTPAAADGLCGKSCKPHASRVELAAPLETRADGPRRAPVTGFLAGCVSDRADPGGAGISYPDPPEHRARDRVPTDPRGGRAAHPAGARGGCS